MKTKQYTRGSYNKQDRRIKKLYISLTLAEMEKVKELSKELELNYNTIFRNAFLKCYNVGNINTI